MKKLLIYYNFIIVSAMVLSGFLGVATIPQLISASLFFPLFIYFGLLILPKERKALVIPQKASSKAQLTKKSKVDDEVVELKKTKGNFDLDRRAFIKLIGSAGLSLFMLSIFTKKAQAAFFGSVPGPGTVAIKDTTGTPIDPAIKHPTDGYRIAELDDSTPAYYGFMDKNGNWFILRDDNGTYKYLTGSSGFSTAWTNRATAPEIDWKYYDEAF